MKLKINKASDLTSISVLPPHRRRSGAASSGLDSSSMFGGSQTAASQLRPQHPQLSQPTASQGMSSQYGLSQFSQNSQEEILTNEKIGSQERENSVRRTSCLPPINHMREENRMMISTTSNNMMRKWSSHEHKCQCGEELEHRIGMIETSLGRLGMIMDSVQSDVMQVNKGTKGITLEMEGMRQKLIVHEDSLQSLNKGQEHIKSHLDACLKSLSDQLKQIMNQETQGEIFSKLSYLSEKIDTQIVKLQNDLHKDFCTEIQAISCILKMFQQRQTSSPAFRPKAVSFHASPQQVQFLNNSHPKVKQASTLPKIETGGWTSVKQAQATSKCGTLYKQSNQIIAPTNQLVCRVDLESDEEIDGCFSCLLKGPEIEEYSIEEAEAETARILRKARRRKRKYRNAIIIN